MSKQNQKSEGLCNNREELTGKKLHFPGMEPRTLLTGTCYIDHGATIQFWDICATKGSQV